MQKYRWSLYKTLEFLNSRRPDLEIRAAFVSQLADFEQKLILQQRGPQTANWNEVADNRITLNQDKFYPDEELLLRNTFLNAHLGGNKSFDRSRRFENFKQENKVEEVPEESGQNRLRWIDNNADDKNMLRTNNSEDDLVCKEKIEAIVSHKSKLSTKSIIKPFQSTEMETQSKDTSQQNKSMERSFHRSEKQDPHYKSMKNKNEPLLINEIDDIDEDLDNNEEELKPSRTQPEEDKASKERMIEEFNSGNSTQKYFVPRKEPISNNTEPIDLQKNKIRPMNESFLKNMSMLKNPNQTQKFVVKKVNDNQKLSPHAKESKKLTVAKVKDQDDSQSNTQKDVIVRRIKKKSDTTKAASQASIGFGHHKKSNSEMIPDAIPKKESFKDLMHNQNSMNVDHNNSLKRPNHHNRGEFKSNHYKKALDKFQEFKKEQQMMRKNTPITKYRKGSAKKSSVS